MATKYKKNLIRIGNPGKQCKQENISQHLHLFDVYYLCGGRTKVVVRAYVDYKYPEVMIVEAPINSKYFYHIGKTVNISRQVLYPRRRK